jgi:hypothetical protein
MILYLVCRNRKRNVWISRWLDGLPAGLARQHPRVRSGHALEFTVAAGGSFGP